MTALRIYIQVDRSPLYSLSTRTVAFMKHQQAANVFMQAASLRLFKIVLPAQW
jgi:hypothetical protein